MKQKSGFSLMEMMIVLLIVSILAAVAAPMVNKKMVRSAGTTSPWNWSGIVGNSIWYDRGDNNMVIIGDSTPPAQNRGGKLYIKSDSARQPQISMTRGNAESLKLAYDENSVWMSTVAPNADATGVVIGAGANATTADTVSIGRNASTTGRGIAIGTRAESSGGVAIGGPSGDRHTTAQSGCVAIGDGTSATNSPCTAVGVAARAEHPGALALGNNSTADQSTSIAIGSSSRSTATGGVSIGSQSQVTAGSATALGQNAQGLSQDSVAIGVGSMTTGQINSIAVGRQANANSQNGIAIGSNSAVNTGTNCIAIGNTAISRNHGIRIGQGSASSGAFGTDSIAIGNNAHSGTTNGVAIGNTANVGGSNSLALGFNTRAQGNNSVAIGSGVTAQANQIVLGNNSNTVIIPGALQMAAIVSPTTQLKLGDANTCVYIPGSLVVDKNVYLNRSWNGEYNYSTYLGMQNKRGDGDSKKLSNFQYRKVSDRHGVVQWHQQIWPSSVSTYGVSSDMRLKRVGESFTYGLEQIKKLEVFNFTFRKDPTQTPQVGVMAQDLQKIFPNAVIKGEDGFLRIRTEEILYSLVNAVKELDAKITALIQDNQKEIKALRGEVNSLKKENAELLKRLEALEKKIK